MNRINIPNKKLKFSKLDIKTALLLGVFITLLLLFKVTG
jgi:hypothetical protein